MNGPIMESQGERESSGRAAAGGRFLRPQPTRWFELLTARDDLTVAVEALARSSCVELEIRSEEVMRLRLPDLEERLETYHRLAERYHPYWPSRDELLRTEPPGPPLRTLERALARMEEWRHSADPLVRRHERLNGEGGTLSLLEEWLLAVGEESALRPSLLKFATGSFPAHLFVLPREGGFPPVRPTVLGETVRSERHLFLLAVGPRREMRSLEQAVAGAEGRRVRVHEALKGTVAGSIHAIHLRRKAIRREQEAIDSELRALSERHDLFRALGDTERLQWFLRNLSGLPVTEHFAWVTGWTSDTGDGRLNRALRESGVRALLRFTEPPEDADPPMLMRNPRWARPFEMFARLFGMPGPREADPARLLALVVPLMFGYMFGDVGQGLVLATVGVFSYRRWPTLRILVPAGLASALFGFAFGSVFSREDVIAPLWLHATEAPVTVLVVPVIAGAVLLLVGLVLNGMEASWRGEGRNWLWRDAGLLPLYAGLVAAPAWPGGVWVGMAGLGWYVLGAARVSRNIGAFLAGLGELAEQLLRLAVNTLSFARIGAFALAHSGLSIAVATLASATGNPLGFALVLAAGNLVIILLEGLVVSIQLTRLLLFEFFVRFLRGEGRLFRPLTAPPVPETPQQRSPG